ncbi:hypothetical protein V6N11_077204 [Hibiscus sabdariffa]|uniref:RNase H type-1 domain-containing protein n=1 Tax=Hibiscus sabdariffa TaxID=183260 RepID=A0ABR2TCF7_9ROSI
MHNGLLLACSFGFEYVQIQSDCLQAISLINDPEAHTSSISLVCAIVSLCRRAWVTSFLWIPHATNGGANLLVKKHGQFYDLIVLNAPLGDVVPLLFKDAHCFNNF